MSVTCKLNIAREATQTHSWAFRIRHTARRKIIFLFFLIESINNQMHCLDFSPHRRLSWLSARLFSFKEPNSKDFLALETFPRKKKESRNGFNATELGSPRRSNHRFRQIREPDRGRVLFFVSTFFSIFFLFFLFFFFAILFVIPFQVDHLEDQAFIRGR